MVLERLVAGRVSESMHPAPHVDKKDEGSENDHAEDAPPDAKNPGVKNRERGGEENEWRDNLPREPHKKRKEWTLETAKHGIRKKECAIAEEEKRRDAEVRNTNR